MKQPSIGAHVSSNGGVHSAVLNGERIGAKVIQIFGSSPYTWAVRRDIPSDELKKYREYRKRSSIENVYLHAAYIVNLASHDQSLYEKSVKSLVNHLCIAEILEAQGLIFHVGSFKETEKEKAIEQQIEGMKRVLKAVQGKTSLIMENTAGGGSRIGSIEDLGYMLTAVKSERMKVCFDTAHGFESGEVETYTKATVEKMCDDFEEHIGLKNISVLHVNDSKTECGSHHDRHENIGKGYIGIGGFRALAGEKRLYDKDWILEVPGYDNKGPDKKNIDVLHSLFS